MPMRPELTESQIEQVHQAYIASPFGREEFAEKSIDVLGFEVSLGTLTDWVHERGWGRDKEKAKRKREIERLSEVGDELGVVRQAAYQSILDLSAAGEVGDATALATIVRAYLSIHDVDKGRDMKQGEYVTRDQAVAIAIQVAREFADGAGAN